GGHPEGGRLGVPESRGGLVLRPPGRLRQGTQGGRSGEGAASGIRLRVRASDGAHEPPPVRPGDLLRGCRPSLVLRLLVVDQERGRARRGRLRPFARFRQGPAPRAPGEVVGAWTSPPASSSWRT